MFLGFYRNMLAKYIEFVKVLLYNQKIMPSSRNLAAPALWAGLIETQT